MKVSVIIPARNEEKSIGRCLSAMSSQEYGNDFETMVVDDGSTDRTADIAKRYGAKVVASNKGNLGYSKNFGTRLCSGDVCFYMDADSVAPKNWISRIMEEYDKDKKTVMAGSLCRFDEAPYHSLYQPLSLARTILGKLSIPTLPGSSMSILKDIFYKTGGFVEDACEDADISFKARKFGKVKLIRNLPVLTSSRSWKKKNGLINHYVFNPVYVVTNGRVNLAESTRKM